MIRRATTDDARALAEVQVRGWRWAYGDIVGDDDMPTIEDRQARWDQAALDGTSIWDQDGQIAGFVSIGLSRDDGAEPSTGEVYALYVDPPAQGAGVGDALHEHALVALRAAGYERATLWTFAANGHAREFYEARGWRPDGATGEWAGAASVRYGRDL